MHIQERTHTTLTTCTKMTEEVDRRHGVNGNSSGKSANEDAPVQSAANATAGGRLKFFKDGKFILELVRGCAREGERAGWVSVPRKTFWPPAAAPHTPPTPPTPQANRHERAASLSVSDDNSSIQSSPWQRDHCWKQNNPRKNISKELALYYCRPNTLLSAAISAAGRSKRRRPYDATRLDAANGPSRLGNGLCADRKRNGNGNGDPDGEDTVDGTSPEKYYHVKLKKPYQYYKPRVYKKTRPPKRRDLGRAIGVLQERAATQPAPINAKLASCRQEHAMVSPRKRILRELERVTLEDQGCKRRAKTAPAPALSTASYPPSPGPSHAHKPPAERAHNGTAPPRKDPPPTRNVSSYSIHSLLSMPDEPAPSTPSPSAPAAPDAKRSPHTYKIESLSGVPSPDLSPSPDSYRYRYSALTLGSPAGAGAGPMGGARDSPTPPPELSARYRPVYAPPPTSPYAGAARTARTSPLCYAPASASAISYRGAPREEWRDVPYLYGAYGPYLPAMYRAPPAAAVAHAAHAPLWMQYTMPPGPWAPLPHPLLTDHVPKEESTSDLPLNLSKH